MKTLERDKGHPRGFLPWTEASFYSQMLVVSSFPGLLMMSASLAQVLISPQTPKWLF